MPETDARGPGCTDARGPRFHRVFTAPGLFAFVGLCFDSGVCKVRVRKNCCMNENFVM